MQNEELNSLVISAKQHSEAAFNQIYKMYENKIFAICLSTLKHHQDAENATQQTFIKVYEKLSTLDDVSAFNTWIQKIAINECKQILRQRHADISTDDDEGGGILGKIEDDFMLPQDYAEKSDLSDRMREIIAKLPAVQRQALVLSIYNNMTYAEIADIMDCTENTVKSRIRYAKAFIKNEIEERERRTGEKFYGVALVPFAAAFTALIVRNSLTPEQSAQILESVKQNILSSGGCFKSSQAALKTASKAASKGALGLGAKIGIAAGIAAVVVASVIGADTLISNFLKPDTATPDEVAAVTEAVTQTPTETETVIETEVKETETEKPTEPDYTAIYSDYLDVLLKNEADIIKSEDLYYEEDADIVAFEDITGDGSPEMIYTVAQIAGDETHHGMMYVTVVTSDGDGANQIYPDSEWDINSLIRRSDMGYSVGCICKTDNGVYFARTSGSRSDYPSRTTINEMVYSDGVIHLEDVYDNESFDDPDIEAALDEDITKVVLSTYSDMEAEDSMTFDEAVEFLKEKSSEGGEDNSAEEKTVEDYVTTSRSVKGKFSSGMYINDEQSDGTVTCRMPKIIIDSNDAEEINSEIEDEYGEFFDNAITGTEFDMRIDYVAYLNDSVLSLVVEKRVNYNGLSFFLVYNIDVKTGNRIDRSEIFDLCGISSDEAEEYLRSAMSDNMQDAGEAVRGSFDKADMDNYDKALAKTQSQENVDDAEFYINGDGTLCAVYKQYTPVNAGPDARYIITVLDAGIK